MQPVGKLRCSSEGGAWLQRCLAGTLQHFEDLVLGCLPNALDEGQEAARSCGFGQTCRFQLLLLGLPMFEELRGRIQVRGKWKETVIGMPLQHALTSYSFSVLKYRTVLTDGHPLHWDLTFSAMIPTAASLASTDLTTPATSFPATSNRPASVPTNVRACLRRKRTFNTCPYQKSHVSTQSIYLSYLPGHNFSGGRSAGVDSQWVCFFSHGWTDETIFKCEHCNRTGLLAHTQDLVVGTWSQDLLVIEEGW